MSGFSLDIGPLKEPLGFMRLLEWVFAIFAFASTCGYSGSSSFTLLCQKTIHVINATFQYPFRLNENSYNVPVCKGNISDETIKYQLMGNYSSSAGFFVAIGILAFLYCILTLVLYLGYQHLYRERRAAPVLDLIITGIFTFLWLVASSAWAKGLSDVKTNTSPNSLLSVATPCKLNPCTSGAVAAFGPLNSGVIAGFLNVILWAGNCWFIFKETPFHQSLQSPAPTATHQEGRQP